MNDFVKLKKLVEKNKIKSWVEYNVETHGKKYIINDDLTIDVNGYVHLKSRNFEELPDYIKFGKTGIFGIGQNFNLKSTKGFPKKAEEILCNGTTKLYRPDGFKGKFFNNTGSEKHSDGTITDGSYKGYLKWKNKKY